MVDRQSCWSPWGGLGAVGRLRSIRSAADKLAFIPRVGHSRMPQSGMHRKCDQSLCHLGWMHPRPVKSFGDCHEFAMTSDESSQKAAGERHEKPLLCFAVRLSWRVCRQVPSGLVPHSEVLLPVDAKVALPRRNYLVRVHFRSRLRHREVSPVL